MNEQLRRRSMGGPAAGHVWQETLIGALETLDHETPSAPRALARSVAAGWLSTERHGRRSRVRLTPATHPARPRVAQVPLPGPRPAPHALAA